jgi:predicted nuclease of predicted toxin-antitoxin system
VRLLLDEMFSHVVAEQLRRRGQDAIAVTERADLRGQPDVQLIEAAHLEGRAIVTENTTDFRVIVEARLREGRAHSGMVYTQDRRHSRKHPRAIGRLVRALERFLEDPPDGDSWERWLA